MVSEFTPKQRYNQRCQQLGEILLNAFEGTDYSTAEFQGALGILFTATSEANEEMCVQLNTTHEDVALTVFGIRVGQIPDRPGLEVAQAINLLLQDLPVETCMRILQSLMVAGLHAAGRDCHKAKARCGDGTTLQVHITKIDE